MKVFKFGGASVNSASAVRNVANILKDYQTEYLIAVFSAMGKTTNALEEVAKEGFKKSALLDEKLVAVEEFHFQIVDDLFREGGEKVIDEVKNIFVRLKKVATNLTRDFDEYYDSVVPFGEALSTFIISAYLHSCDMANNLVDAKSFVVTDNNFRDAAINWPLTCEKVNQVFKSDYSNLRRPPLFITQGFVGGTVDGRPTTLGREGSDFTASILAYCLDAEEVVVWKDVDGLLNADPVYFSDTIKVDRLSYHETIELAFYGAKILHPKTIKPLQNKQIPLLIKSFYKPNEDGSLIHQSRHADHLVPFLILKKNQVLLSFSIRDFSFITEEKLQKLFGEFNLLNIKVNLMQNSAISFTVCVNHPGEKLGVLIERLKNEFEIYYNDNLELLTIRHFDDETINKHLTGCKILFEQRSRRTIQVAYKRDD